MIAKIETLKTTVLTHLRVEKSGEVRSVIHVHFTTWPDHGVPETAEDCLELVDFMRQSLLESHAGLPIVHCSAGIGRTGVVLGTDIGIDQLLEFKQADPMSILRQMRVDRGAMIQHYEQLEFMHRCLVTRAEGLKAAADEQ